MDDATVPRTPEETPTVVVSTATPEPERRQLTPGTIIGGRYRIVSMLGRGGMGEVYRADDLRMGQPVALKSTLSQIVVDTTFYAIMSWIAYIALEPLVRRRWPRMLISSTRLMSGQWRDPIVGRDLLAGAAAGVLIILIWHATALTPGAAPMQLVYSVFGETPQVLYFLTYKVAEAIMRPVGLLMLIVALRAFVRNEAIAIAVGGLLAGLMNVSDAAGDVTARATYAVLSGVIAVALLVRFGAFALVCAAYFVLLLRGMPLTLDASAWYFGRSLIGFAILIGLAVTGFVLALGGRASLPRLALDD